MKAHWQRQPLRQLFRNIKKFANFYSDIEPKIDNGKIRKSYWKPRLSLTGVSKQLKTNFEITETRLHGLK